MDWLNDNSGAVQGIAVVLLAVITAVYAYFTQKMAREMREQRLDTLRPLVLPRIDHSTTGVPSNLTVIAENVGHGPAINVCVTVEHSALIYSERACFSYLRVGQVKDSFLGGPDIPAGTTSEDFVGTYHLKAKYGDIHGRRYETELPVEVERTDSGDLEQQLGSLSVRRIEIP